MLDAKSVIELITDDDVIVILNELGSSYPKHTRDGLLFQTVCHNDGSGKFKLHYHSKDKSFFCYTNCGKISNIFQLVMHTRDIKFGEAFKFVCNMLNIQIGFEMKYGFDTRLDNSFINKFYAKDEYDEVKMIIRNDIVLNRFWDLYHQSWIDDHITMDVMREFNIKFDISGNRIIIPHYDINNNLVGIRARNLDENIVAHGKKYMPIFLDNILYNYPTGLNLYGLNINKKAIKKYKRVTIGEAEKFVMQHKSFYGNKSTAVALNGSFLTTAQIKLLQDLGVEVITLCLDKEFETQEQEQEYKTKINKTFVTQLLPYFTLEILWDTSNLLELKDSPADKGKEIYEELYKNRIIL